ncbi:LysR family transcriptional regulator [Streptomyces sp. 4F14]|uniref:LysR family transcriptional regulator n=1 Tax=Streptomyces sp. 4F14 TaxID=3394380 RepID=UPI003A8C659C
MELRHLRYFVAVAEEGSVNRAALRLHVSQPSLSRQIAQLERELGQRLLERTSRGVRLTPAGQMLLPHAHQLLTLADATRETVAGAATARQPVTLGVPPGTDGTWLVALVDTVRARLPHVALEYVEATSSEQLRLLGARLLDLGLVHRPPPIPSTPGNCATICSASPYGPGIRSRSGAGSGWRTSTAYASCCTRRTGCPPSSTGSSPPRGPPGSGRTGASRSSPSTSSPTPTRPAATRSSSSSTPLPPGCPGGGGRRRPACRRR